MNTQLYKKYADTPAIGGLCLCNWGGIEILDITNGINDYVVACYNYGRGRQKIRKHKIEYASSGRNFFRKDGRRYYFDEATRY